MQQEYLWAWQAWSDIADGRSVMSDVHLSDRSLPIERLQNLYYPNLANVWISIVHRGAAPPVVA